MVTVASTSKIVPTSVTTIALDTELAAAQVVALLPRSVSASAGVAP